jgi:undecaprenyl-diphosphatase
MIRLIATNDRRLMRRVNRWAPPSWVRTWMFAASRGGDGWLWSAVGLVVLLFGGERRGDALKAGFLAVASGIAAFLILKRITGRERPITVEPHSWSSLLPPDRFSFPSGHTITAFAVAVSIGLFYPALIAGLIFCALSVAASRVLLGLHYLSDVVAGILIGTAVGLIAFHWAGSGVL